MIKGLKDKSSGIRVINEEQEKAQKAMEEIKQILNREDANGNVNDRISYLKSIKGTVANKKGNMNKEPKKYLLKLIDQSISEEKDQIYYEQVKAFTKGFQFLREYPEIMMATNGLTVKKFTNRETYKRFCSLRMLVQDGFSEYSQVNRLLEDESVNDADKRILEARKSVMDKEIERREIEGR